MVKHSSGYVLVRKPEHPKCHNKTGYVFEHRLVFEEFYKCCLLDWVDIHHKNGIKNDNRIENLEVESKSKHHKNHLTELNGALDERICSECNSKSTFINNQGFPMWYKVNDLWRCKKCYDRLVRQRKKEMLK